jgi:hypothetical protein
VRALRSIPRADVLRCAILVGGLTLAAPTAPLDAQLRPDSARAVVDSTGPRPERKPPISPRRAFLYSLFVPGYAQSILGRNRAGSVFVAFEAASLTMIRLSAADVREARRNLADSIIVSFIDANGSPQITYQRMPFTSSLIRSRRAHLEDWIAVLMANHLFSAADAYVAALLWDLPAEVALRAAPRSAGFSMRVYW